MKRAVGNLVREVQSGVILHQVNCQGVMGSGIAKELRETYPVVWEEYKALCSRRASHALLGMAQLVRVSDALYVANLFGQLGYGRDGRRHTSYDALDTALSSIAAELERLDIPTSAVHHPYIGCGLGGGSWPVVEALISTHLGDQTTLWTLA